MKNINMLTLNKKNLINNNINLPKIIAKYFYKKLNFYLEIEELIELANFGFIEAVHSYKVIENIEFKTYATYKIKGYILDELRKNDTLNQKQRNLYTKIQSHLDYAINNQQSFNHSQIASDLKVSLKKYFFILDNEKKIDNFDQSDEIMSDYDIIDDIEKKELYLILKKNIMELSSKEKIILQLIYIDDYSFLEVAKSLNISKTRVSQIHSKILLKLRNKMIVFNEIS